MKLNNLVLVFAIAVGSYGIELQGNILDNKTNEELTGAKIIINNTDTVYSGFDGEFTYQLNDSIIDINITYPSYEAYNVIIKNENINSITKK